MDLTAWLVLAGVVLATIVIVALAPWLKRDDMKRQRAAAGGALGGIGSGFDAVWRPSAEEAQADWEAQVELPAPSPLAGDKGRIDDGRIVIDIDERDTRR